MNVTPGLRTMYLGRFLVVLATLALVGAWITPFTGETLLGMTQQHLFSDATVLALLGIANFGWVLACENAGQGPAAFVGRRH